MVAAGAVTKPVLFVGSFVAKPLMFAGQKAFNSSAKFLGLSSAKEAKVAANSGKAEGVFFSGKNGTIYESKHVPGNLRAWDLFKSTKQSGARELSIAEYGKVDALAEKVYDSIRNSQVDIELIAKNTGIPKHRIQKIKNHIFNNKHELAYGLEKFAPDPLVAEAWKRMELGSHTHKDIALLKHELFESKFEGIFNTDYRTAHNA